MAGHAGPCGGSSCRWKCGYRRCGSCCPPRLRIGDLAAPDIAVNFWRRRTFEAAPIPVRLFAELGEVQVIRPAWVLAELTCNGCELPVPASLGVVIVD